MGFCWGATFAVKMWKICAADHIHIKLGTIQPKPLCKHSPISRCNVQCHSKNMHGNNKGPSRPGVEAGRAGKHTLTHEKCTECGRLVR